VLHVCCRWAIEAAFAGLSSARAGAQMARNLSSPALPLTILTSRERNTFSSVLTGGTK
jgi:hypothetical protein